MMSRQRVEVLLAVRALEPDGYGEAVRLYLKHCGAGMCRAPIYRQLQCLCEAGLIEVVRYEGVREHLKTTAKGRKLLHGWVRRLCRIARVA